MSSIQKLRNKYKGQTCYIVGRGPSLLRINKSHFGPGVVIVLNEAIMNICELGLSNDVYSQWRNGDLPADLLKYLNPHAGDVLLLCENRVLDDPPSSGQFLEYPNRYIFECKRDFGGRPPLYFSHWAAVEIALIMGCNTIINMGFDSYLGEDKTVLKNNIVQSEYKPGDYNEQISIICKRFSQLSDVDVKWFFAEEKKIAKPVRLNVGCGEVIEPGYINIDLHCKDADVKMDARALEYPNESVDEIYSSHLLEHLGKREVSAVLREWFRVLKVGGVLKMNLPNLEWCLRNWLGKDEKDKFGLALDMIFGLQTHDGEYHKTGFTGERLKSILSAAGFGDIVIEDKNSHAQQCFFITAVKKKSDDRITVITLTGDRPLAFALCKRWMSQQTRKPHQWIVVDDGRTPLTPVAGMEYIRREPQADDPRHTMILNMRAALPFVKGAKILIMEDDEYYAPRYIEEMERYLEKYAVVGIGRSKYYHLPSGSCLKDCNMDNASLAQTAFKNTFLPEFERLLSGDQYVDMRIWKKVGETNQLRWNDEDKCEYRIINGRGFMFDDGEKNLYCGMKGLPGRAGICWGHRPDGRYPMKDTIDRNILRQWIPNDWTFYLDVLSGKLTSDIDHIEIGDCP